MKQLVIGRFMYWPPWQRSDPWTFHWGKGGDEDCNTSRMLGVPGLGMFVVFTERPMRPPGTGVCDECIRTELADGATPRMIALCFDASHYGGPDYDEVLRRVERVSAGEEDS